MKQLIIIILAITLFSSCQYRSQRKDMEQIANALIAQADSASLSHTSPEQELTTSYLDSLRGYPLAETSKKSTELNYNQGVAIAIGIGILFIGFFFFRIIKGFKKGMKSYSYAAAELKEKSRSIMNDSKQYSKMNQNEKEKLDDLMNMFEKKWKK